MPNEDRFMAFSMFMSSGTGWRMISSKNFSPSSILLSHSPGPPGVRSLHQNPVPLAIGELTLTETCLSS